MTDVELDAGALIALERQDRAMWAALKLAAKRGEAVLVPSTVLAQVWRGTRRQVALARALASCVIAPFDGLARAVGELCARTRSEDICDAHVALVATDRAVLYTSDPRDLRRLLAACGGATPVVVRC